MGQRGKRFTALYLNTHTVEPFFEQDHIVVNQYTGLKDKNGKKIYKDDIVLHFGFLKHQVVFRNGAFGYYTSVDTFVTYANQHLELNPKTNRLMEVEKIGNIHQNPELLK